MILEKNENYIPKFKKNYIFVQKIIYNSYEFSFITTFTKTLIIPILIYQYTYYHL